MLNPADLPCRPCPRAGCTGVAIFCTHIILKGNTVAFIDHVNESDKSPRTELRPSWYCPACDHYFLENASTSPMAT